MVGILRQSRMIMLSTTSAAAITVSALDGLLTGETQGFAIDATTIGNAAYVGGPDGGDVLVGDTTTPANNLDHVPLDASNLVQSGTSAKMVQWSEAPYLRWTPHNLLLQSQDLSTTWANTRTSESVNSTTAPDGTLTADTLIEDGTGSTSHVFHQGFTAVAGYTYCFSIYVKAKERTRIAIGIVDAAGSFGDGAYTGFDASGGQVAYDQNTSFGSGFTPVASGIESVGSGWYRVYQAVTIASDTSPFVNVWMDGGSGVSANGATYSGDGTSGIYLWGAQLNRGYIPTPYLATTSAARIGIPQDYDTYEELFGILVERAATNVLTRSEDLTHAAWTGTQHVVITANSTTAPDGSLTADLVTKDNTLPALLNDITTGSTSSVTYSVFMKMGNWRYVSLQPNNRSSSGKGVLVDLQTGTILSTLSDGSGYALLGSSITSVGNGWYRVSVSVDPDSADGRFMILMRPDGSNTTWAPTWGGNTETIYVWGAQVEDGSVATSYIPTLGSTVTRAADDITATAFPIGSANSSWHQTKVLALHPASGTAVFGASLSDGDFNEEMWHGYEFPQPWFRAFNAGSSVAIVANIDTSWPGPDVMFRGAWYAETDHFNQALEGDVDTEDTSGTCPTVTQARLGRTYQGGNDGTVRLYKIVLVPRRYSDVEIA